MLKLRYTTPEDWKQVALSDLGAFLQDHAANERKVGHAALSLAVQHPDRRELVDAMIDVSREEMLHFRQVYDLLVARGLTLGIDVPDRYMGALFRTLRRKVVDEYLLDRLVLFGVVEARGCERFRMISEALEPGSLKTFYEELTASEVGEVMQLSPDAAGNGCATG